MKHLFVPYESAVKLKEKGFDEPCMMWWDCKNDKETVLHTSHYHSGKWNYLNTAVSAPLYQQVVDWFRDKHYLSIDVSRNYDGWRYCILEFKSGNKVVKAPANQTEDYYQELKSAIEEALKLI